PSPSSTKAPEQAVVSPFDIIIFCPWLIPQTASNKKLSKNLKILAMTKGFVAHRASE
ncbi:MAG: hypothetical protein ACI9HG_002094, partial [Flavobacteriales bacterium]